MRILLLCALVAAACGSSWNYDSSSSNGPDDWPDECVLPLSLIQSPIDIITNDVIGASFPSFTFTAYSDVDVALTNNGHTVQATLKSYENALLTDGGLSCTYRLAQFHLHWGSIDSQGSEHKFDGQQCPMEVHFVHYNTKYTSLGDAADKSDGLAVLAWCFEIDDDSNNAYWAPIFNELPLGEDETPVDIDGLDLNDIMGSSGTFYRYQGSLTTPPCYQSVTWTVFHDKIEIDPGQMAAVRSVVNDHGHAIADNFRPTQDLNCRTVYKS